METSFKVEIVTPERLVVEAQAQEMQIPGKNGYLGILPGHAPLLAMLRIGQMRYRTGTTVMRLVLSWGFAEVLPDRVIVMAETARLPQEIDAAAAEREREEAERALADLSSHDPEFAVVEARLEEAVSMIDLHRGM